MSKPIFDKKNVLVIGGAGFIGSHLCDELIKTSKVICVDNFLTSVERNIDHLLQHPNFEFVRHDINESFALDPRVLGLDKLKATWQGVQEIYFMATPSAHDDIENFPIETMLVNSVGLRNALDLAVANNATFCYVSSDAVYGMPVDKAVRQITESTEGIVRHIDNHGTHAEAQRFGESLVENYRRHKKLEVRVARVFNTYGPRMRLTGSRLVSNFTYRALTQKEIIIYGGSDAVGSYTYVSDIVKGLTKLMEQGTEQPVNLGADVGVRLIDLAHEIINILDSNSEVTVVPDFPDGYRRQLIPNITRAKEELGWFPVTLFGEGLQHTIDDLKASQGLIDVSSWQTNKN